MQGFCRRQVSETEDCVIIGFLLQLVDIFCDVNEQPYSLGESLFDRLVEECGLDPPTDSQLSKLVPSRKLPDDTAGAVFCAEMDGYSPNDQKLNTTCEVSIIESTTTLSVEQGTQRWQQIRFQ